MEKEIEATLLSNTDNDNISPWKVGFASLIPGFGFRVIGLGEISFFIGIAIFALFVLFWFFPSTLTWFIFAVPYVGQMAYCVAIAIHLDQGEVANVPLIKALPEKFSNQKQLVANIEDSIHPIFEREEKIHSAIIGKDENQLFFVCTTERNLLAANCTDAGLAVNPQRYQKDDVDWVSIKMGEINTTLQIEIAARKPIKLTLPKKLSDRAKEFLNDFPGTWESESDFVDSMRNWNKKLSNWKTFVVAIILFVFIALCMYIGETLINSAAPEYEQPIIALSIMFPTGISFFIIGWFPFAVYIQRVKKERAITISNVYLSLGWFKLFSSGDLHYLFLVHLHKRL